MTAAFERTVDRHPDRTFVRRVDDSVAISFGQARTRADAIAGGLASLGVGKGDCVAMLLSNRPEFHLVDLGVITLGATPFSIYLTASPEQIEYVCTDAEASVIVTESALLGNVLAARERLPRLEHVVLVDGGGEGALSLDELERSHAGFDGSAARAAVTPDDVLTLIYTSGTTGPPKGVQLSHRNLMAAVQGIGDLVDFPDHAEVISWLPNAHIAERAAHHYLPITFGMTVTCCPDPRQIVAFLPQVRPSWFFAVPRIWEKLKAGLEARVASQPEALRNAMQGALDAALAKVQLEQGGEPVPEELAAAVEKADAAIFAKLREQLGLDRVRTVNVGAAPTPREVLEFFHAIGIPIAELWGMSETCGAGTANPVSRVKIGTVGPPAPGVELRLAEDGEVLMRGPMVMLGYRNQPEKTAETIDADGWLHTGDIGEIDADGYLRIVDRKKELIINAAGKNMSPANIEATVKASSPLIGNAACIGDGRPYNVALIVLDADFAPIWAAQQGIEDTRLEALAEHPAVREAVAAAIEQANAKLSRVEQIKRFHLVAGDWLPGGDELTPTMKLKRKPIAEKYRAEIEALYA